MIGQEMMINQLRQQIDIRDTPAPRIAWMVAKRENEQTTWAHWAAERHDLDVEVEIVDPEGRANLLLEAAEAAIQQNFAGWWWSTIAPHTFENAEKAKQYVGLSPDEWHATIRDWHRQHYEAGTVDRPPEDVSPAELGKLADKHCRSVYGLTVREFVAGVINWETQAAAEDLLTTPTDQATEVLRRLGARQDA